MLQTGLGRQDPVLGIAMDPIEGGGELGMKIGNGDRLQATGGDGRAQRLRPEIEFLQAHLVVQLI